MVVGMPKIGLEVHVQITTTKTKLFCSCPNDYRDAPPNTNVCPVCLGLPGALPTLNEEAVKKAVLLALALNSKINERIVFARKHYFYPDLPKGFQISQFTAVGSAPIAIGGFIDINVDGKRKRIRIRRIQLEEDPGRLEWKENYVLVDYNRSGVPLLEIVTEPDMEDPKEARAFLEKLRSIVEHLGICECDLQGSMRADANVSVEGGERVEIKNVNSPKDVEKALRFEIARQRSILRSGGVVRRETRHWVSEKGVTVSARAKEVEAEYRYMPEPDLPPYVISKELVETLRKQMPELPEQRVTRMVKEYGISEYLANVLVLEKKLADMFEKAAKVYKNYKRLASFIVIDYVRWRDELGKETDAENIVKILELVDKGIITLNRAKDTVLPKVLETGKKPEEIVKELGLERLTDEDQLKPIIIKVLNENKKAAEDAKKNKKAINFLVGLVMKETRGKADPKIVRKLVEELLNEV